MGKNHRFMLKNFTDFLNKGGTGGHLTFLWRWQFLMKNDRFMCKILDIFLNKGATWGQNVNQAVFPVASISMRDTKVVFHVFINISTILSNFSDIYPNKCIDVCFNVNLPLFNSVLPLKYSVSTYFTLCWDLCGRFNGFHLE